MMKVGVIGLGKMGLSHCSILNAQAEVELAAVCDTSALVLEAFKKFSKSRIYSDYRALFEKEQLDAVIVATPTKLHFEIVKMALQKGMHVFCEKPFSLTVAEGRELVELANKKQLVNQVGYHNRFIGTFNEFKRLVENEIIGEIYHFHGEAYGPVIVKEKGGNWRSSRAEGGGCLFDYASHVINLIQYILGTPVKVGGTLLKSAYSKEVEDTVYSSLTLDNGISGQLSVNWSDETYRKMSTSIMAIGTGGKIQCDATEIKIYLKKDHPSFGLEKGWNIRYITDFAQNVNFYLRGEEYSAQIEYFIQNILNKDIKNLSSFEFALNTDEIIELLINDKN
ncbi:MAG: Gfo/Idh/MocA family oxidoreductase [Bacteroidales bacterium]